MQEWAEDPRIPGGAEDRSPRQDRKGVAGPWQSCGCDLGAGHNRALETSRSHFRERDQPQGSKDGRWSEEMKTGSTANPCDMETGSTVNPCDMEMRSTSKPYDKEIGSTVNPCVIKTGSTTNPCERRSCEGMAKRWQKRMWGRNERWGEQMLPRRQ